MDARLISFGRIEVDGARFDHDVVIARGEIRKRRKRPSKAYRDRYGHTPLSLDEAIPWSSKRLIVGTGASGQLPIMPEVIDEAERRHVELVALPTAEACRMLADLDDGDDVAAILHVTC